MGKEDIGRIAFGAVLGAVLAVAITKCGLAMGDYILRFLVFIVAWGVVVNTADSFRAAYLGLASVISSVAAIGAIFWIALLNNGVIPCFSGIPLGGTGDNGFTLEVLGAFGGVCIVGTFVGGTARPVTLGLLQKLFTMDLEKAKKFEKLLHVVVGICGTAALIVFSIR